MGLTVYSELGCSGQAKEMKESVMDLSLAQLGVPFQIKSGKVVGDPWVLFGKTRYKDFLACLEEGFYPDLSQLKQKVVSAKCKVIKPGVPHAMVFNPSYFSGRSHWWNISDGKPTSISLGSAGLWAIQGGQVAYRKDTGFGQGFQGKSWVSVPGNIKQVSVGDNIVWAINVENQVLVRSQLSKTNPVGSDWIQLDATLGNLKMCSVGPGGSCWAVDHNNNIFRRVGAKATNPMGTKWQIISGELHHVTVGKSGVWGLTVNNEILYRDGTYGLIDDTEGSGWSKIDGNLDWISSGVNIVWGISSNGCLWYRGGISQGSPSGNNWFRVEVGQNHPISWREVESVEGVLVGMDKDAQILGNDAAVLKILKDGQGVRLTEGTEDFSMFCLQDKPSSFTVLSGAWVAFSNNNFTGPCIYHFEDECFSRDTVKDAEYTLKSWEDALGSIRPIVAASYRPVRVQLAVEWDKAEVSLHRSEVRSFTDGNPTEEFVAPKWKKTQLLNVNIGHRFELERGVPEARSLVFLIDDVPKVNFSYVHASSKIETKQEFRQELSGMFTFETPEIAERKRERTETVKLPPTLPPHSGLKVSLVCNKLTVMAPFIATFTRGVESWSVTGRYLGTDGTNIKIKTEDFFSNGVC